MKLFEPYVCKGHTIPTRVVLAPINTGLAENGLPSERLVEFHRQRSGKAIGISIVGNVAVTTEAVSNGSNCVLDQKAAVPYFAKVSDVIKSNGSLAGIQIAHIFPGLNADRRWQAHDHTHEKQRLSEIISSLSSDMLEKSMRAFVFTAELACLSGFELVQIHAAHGYLLCLLLREDLNTRNDAFGAAGPWLEKLIADVKSVSHSALISFRLSLGSQLTTLLDESRVTTEVAKRLLRAGVDVIDFSAGFYSLERSLIYPQTLASSFFHVGETAASSLDAPVIVAGRVNELRGIESIGATNMLVGLGRTLIADPEAALKVRDGFPETINRCCLKGHCHYFTRGKTHISCGVNSNI